MTASPPPTGSIPVIPWQATGALPADATPDSPADLAALIERHLEALRSRGADTSVITRLADELRRIEVSTGT